MSDEQTADQTRSRLRPDNWVNLVMAETEQVRQRLLAELDPSWNVAYQLLGLIPNATRRLATELESNGVQDLCAFLHACWVFNDGLAALMMIERGMLGPAYQSVRHLLESTAQATLFLGDAKLAEAWMDGRRFSPGDVRKKLPRDGDNLRVMYDALSDIAHVNPESVSVNSFGVEKTKTAILLGGSYQPRLVSTLLHVMCQLLIYYLQAFYDCYQERLTLAVWPTMLIGLRGANDGLLEYSASMTDDRVMLRDLFAAEPATSPVPLSSIDQEQLRRINERLLGRPEFGEHSGDSNESVG